ncbi:MAG TPA: PilC/PilY family type IV pilus protein [Smithellaceae bacterium]|nr:PilC/PilY family type IV pilus protein [Smithellaceae bacterium]HRS88754.1 PilC/PilY family type IV pilus protein [Smithellaceae bacterium]HRV26515.1 PilC/PilY family type IV pilus protein [Smithellaceae bacterium]
MQSQKNIWRFVWIIILIIFLTLPGFVRADDPELPPENDEQDTFADVSPDALIVLDLSGSMLWTPAGLKMYKNNSVTCGVTSHPYYGKPTGTYTDECRANPYNNCNLPGGPTCGTGSAYTYNMNTPYWSNAACSGPFYFNPTGEYTTDCRRVAIAKRSLFAVMDDNSDNKVDKFDAETLGIRIGYMRFRGGNDTGGDYASGNNQLITGISNLGLMTGTSYQRTYCGKTGSTSSCLITDTCSGSTNCIARSVAEATSGTPLVYSLKEAKKYLDVHKDRDPAKECRQKFVIFVSDGADTYSCATGCDCRDPLCTEGCGAECQENMYKRRRESVAAAKALADAGYRVYVVGFGADMPAYLKNTLEWMAYYGGTNNPRATDSGNAQSYNLPVGCNSDPPIAGDCCTFPASATGASATPAACYPGGAASCADLGGTSDSAYCDATSYPTFRTTTAGTDPGYETLGGYAFLAQDGDELTAALKSAISTIRETTYSFTQASIQAIRTADENFIYEASFEPVSFCPFWLGYLKRYNLDVAGNLIVPTNWDAGAVLSNQSASGRNMFTLIGNAREEFSEFNSTISATHLNAASSTERNMIINYFRGGEKISEDPLKYWRLGDIFHSSPLSIATPNLLFYDRWDKSDPKAYNEFRDDHIRTSANGKRLMIVGANDGQLHAFRTGELIEGGGTEMWSFIPPNQLRRLKLIAHPSHPTSLVRQYYVDGPTSAAEIWVKNGAATTIYNTYKSKEEWMTLLVTSQGRGGMSTLWSSSTGCDSGFSPDYTTTYNNYCGYYAFDISDTASLPIYKWRIGGNAGLTALHGKHLAQPWSRMTIGRVRINNTERWVGLIGGGYSGCGRVVGQCDERGKSFYVIDLKDGSILWTYNYATDATMNYDLVAGPTAVDSDNDGFWDTAYVGDLGGNIWRFKFCTKAEAEQMGGCGIANWSGKKLLNEPAQSTIRPIYTSVTVAVDTEFNLWVYVGTGDKTNPTAPNAQERFYAIKDADRTSTYTIADLLNLGSSGVYDPSDPGGQIGWYITFSGSEKVLAEPVVYQGNVYFTTYVPNKGGSDPCNTAGEALVYNLDYITGAGQWEGGARSISLGEGSGVPSAVVVSVSPEGDVNLYVSTSVARGGAHGTPIADPSLQPASGSLIYWQDMRIR